MADRDDIYRWLQGAAFRWVSPGIRPMVERLVTEGRAEWVNRWNRARSIPPGTPKSPKSKSPLYRENTRLRRALESIRDGYDHENDAHKYNNGACRVCIAEAALSESAEKGE